MDDLDAFGQLRAVWAPYQAANLVTRLPQDGQQHAADVAGRAGQENARGHGLLHSRFTRQYAPRMTFDRSCVRSPGIDHEEETFNIVLNLTSGDFNR